MTIMDTRTHDLRHSCTDTELKELSGGRFRGMAPEAKLVVGKVLEKQSRGLMNRRDKIFTCDSMQEALEWVLCNGCKRSGMESVSGRCNGD